MLVKTSYNNYQEMVYGLCISIVGKIISKWYNGKGVDDLPGDLSDISINVSYDAYQDYLRFSGWNLDHLQDNL